MRMAFLRGWDTICEGRNERILSSDVMEEEVMLWSV